MLLSYYLRQEKQCRTDFKKKYPLWSIVLYLFFDIDKVLYLTGIVPKDKVVLIDSVKRLKHKIRR